MIRILLQILALLLLAAVLGTAANRFGPRSIPWVQDWDRMVEIMVEQAGLKGANMAEVEQMIETASHIILDARKLPDYEAGHIPSSLSLPAQTFEEAFPNVQPFLAPEFPVCVYCSGRQCDESILVGRQLKELGYTNTVVFIGGFEEWKTKRPDDIEL